jgi:hypothetical protein
MRLMYMVSVGSTNFGMRSFELNDEASLNVYDEQFAHQMTEVFEHDLKSSTIYTYSHWRNRAWLEKTAEIFVIPEVRANIPLRFIDEAVLRSTGATGAALQRQCRLGRSARSAASP